MTRTAESYKSELFQRLPRGTIWPTIGDEATVWDALLDCCANEFARLRDDSESWLYDFFPDQTEQQLEDWERFLGLPDCGVALGTDEERRAAIVARLRRRSTMTLANVQAIADEFNNGAVVSAGGLGDMFLVGLDTVGDTPVSFDDAATTVTITYDSPQSDAFECTMRHSLPAHITVIFEVNP